MPRGGAEWCGEVEGAFLGGGRAERGADQQNRPPPQPEPCPGPSGVARGCLDWSLPFKQTGLMRRSE